MRKLWPEKPSLHILPRSNAVLTSTTKPACVKGFPDEYWNREPCLPQHSRHRAQLIPRAAYYHCAALSDLVGFRDFQGDSYHRWVRHAVRGHILPAQVPARVIRPCRGRHHFSQPREAEKSKGGCRPHYLGIQPSLRCTPTAPQYLHCHGLSPPSLLPPAPLSASVHV